VLVVEDDEQVRRLVGAILERAGYTVLEAASGDEAEQLCAHPNQRATLLLTDVVMPRLNGPQVAERLTRSNPALCVLYMSGYGKNAVIKHGMLDPSVAFVAKPITPGVLLRRVREVLAAHEAAALRRAPQQSAVKRRLEGRRPLPA
jgi:hypothetical protein